MCLRLRHRKRKKRQSKKEDWRCKESGWSKGLGKWEERQERTQMGDDEGKQGEGPWRSMRSPRMSANVMRVFMASHSHSWSHWYRRWADTGLRSLQGGMFRTNRKGEWKGQSEAQVSGPVISYYGRPFVFLGPRRPWWTGWTADAKEAWVFPDR